MSPGVELALGLLLVLAATLPIALTRAAPVTVAVLVVCANALSYAPFGRVTAGGGIALLVVLYGLGRSGRRLLAVLPVPVFVGFAVAAAVDGGAGDRVRAVLVASGVCVVAGAGTARRARDEAQVYSAAAEAVADSLHEHAARGERARIARELHDVVAHHISMISVQAETARLTTTGLPPEGAKRFQAIGDTARAALTEMRRLLGVLREDAGTSGGRKPQPALDQLIELVDEVRAASGAATRLIVRGRVVPLDPGIELTAYRIVQEALTNARRHAPGAAVDVELTYTDAELRVRVRDNGPGPRGQGRADGHGLVGMAERAAMVGGRLDVRGAPGGGFVVEATLPVPDEGAV
ncbi:sensor histidine kinase [Yinghuangia seranimata]|nr:sensor histidine kinase [Yinghuangia seranimata]MDI2132902.1 sensor histidine kinase [Yinghuangia seranimata]